MSALLRVEPHQLGTGRLELGRPLREGRHQLAARQLDLDNVPQVLARVARAPDVLLAQREQRAIELARQARNEGFNSLRQSALEKVIQGVTSLEEANRVTKD